MHNQKKGIHTRPLVPWVHLPPKLLTLLNDLYHTPHYSNLTHFTHPGFLEIAQTDSMSRYTHFTHPGLLEVAQTDSMSCYTHFTHPGLLEVAQAEMQSSHIVEDLWWNISLHLLLQDASSCAVGWQRPLDEHVEQTLSRLDSESENVTCFSWLWQFRIRKCHFIFLRSWHLENGTQSLSKQVSNLVFYAQSTNTVISGRYTFYVSSLIQIISLQNSNSKTSLEPHLNTNSQHWGCC